ncbi:MAG TPA: hypothetical protein PLB91_07750 [Spirochaetales bacterium]|nr:hypothetical protein [Spirochaetales bacterium]HRY55926.1 hypothetical protein [Spirochaetia bacterium]
MRRVSAVLLTLALGSSLAALPSPGGFRFDLSAYAALPVTWYADGPALRHSGWGASAGAEYELEAWVPGRLELSYFGYAPSAISEGGELYRAWHGLRVAALAGYRFEPFEALWSSRLGLLAGGALTAAGYTDTNLAFAYPSLLAELRLDLAAERESFLWIGLPFEYMFRGAFRTASLGLALGWRMGPVARAPSRPAPRKGARR